MRILVSALFLIAALQAEVRAQAPSGTAADTEVINMLPGVQGFARPPTAFQAGMSIAPMARATIFVRNVDESLKLYRDILGLKPMFDNLWKGKGINAIMGTEGLDLRATVLMAGESVVGNIGIYQVSPDTEAVPAPRQTPDTRTGDFAVVFPTNDIWTLTEKIKAAGYVIVSPPVTLIERPGYKEQPVEMMFRDADGVLVNLVQAGVPE
ncbi:MAG: VOC family protein [Rhodobacteraceae bacterium]|nr:VOC family protein [Paracoccaceae bacterium]